MEETSVLISDVKSQMKVEGKVRKICEICKKSFTDLSRHKITHVERKFPCNICGLKIRTKESLVNHMECRHMGISKKPYFCQVCGIHYSNTAHKLTHMDQSKVEKFTCNTCGKQMRFNKNLKKHERMHERVERNEVVYSNDFKLEVLEKAKEIGFEKMAKLVGVKESTIKGWGEDEGHRKVLHHPLHVKKEVVAFALANNNTEAEKKFNIGESTIRGWIKKMKNGDLKEDFEDFAPRKDYVQKKYSAQVLNILLDLFLS